MQQRQVPPCLKFRDLGCGLWRNSNGARLSERSAQRQEIPEIPEIPVRTSQIRRPSTGSADGNEHEHARRGRAYGGYAKLRQSPSTIYEEPVRAEDTEDFVPSPKRGQTVAELEDEIRFTAARMTASLECREHGACAAELSVYGAAIVLPQLARSAHWPKMLTQLCIRSYVFLAVNLMVQGCILTMISKEEMVMDVYAGQMYLCDFGAFVKANDCQKGTSCLGPGGTRITTPRIYPWAQWTTRMFVKNSLLKIFPNKTTQIEHAVDPGEYGVEDYWCRWLCCFLFIMSVMDDLQETFWMLRLFLAVPTAPESWILDKESVRPNSVRVYHEMEHVRLRIAGMPLHWKVACFVIVWVPKALIWKLTAQAGVTFLLDTAGIEDIIVNSVALTFILGIDEMMFQNLMSTSTKDMLVKVEAYPIYRPGLEEDVSIEEIAARYDEQFGSWKCIDVLEFIPIKLVIGLLLTMLFGFDYYWRHCTLPAGNNIIGGWVSKNMSTPRSPVVTALNAFFPTFFPIATNSQVFWTMPQTSSSGR